MDRMLTAISNFFSHPADQYAIIPTKLLTEPEAEVPQELRSSGVPNLGSDQEEMLLRSLSVSPNNAIRIKWLKAIHTLRQSPSTNWVLDKAPAVC